MDKNYRRQYLNDLKMSKADIALHDMAWNNAIDASIDRATKCIGIETLLAIHVAMEIRRLKYV